MTFPHSEPEQLHNIYNGMESNMTHVSKRNLKKDMYPTFPPALNSDASLSLYHKNNKRVSMGGVREEAVVGRMILTS